MPKSFALRTEQRGRPVKVPGDRQRVYQQHKAHTLWPGDTKGIPAIGDPACGPWHPTNAPRSRSNFYRASHAMDWDCAQSTGASHPPGRARVYTLLPLRSGPPLTLEVVGARRLSRIERATRKGRNPRLRLAIKHAYCSPGRLRPTARS